MKKISVWAKHHVFATRVIVSIIHILLVLIAFYISQNIQFNFSFIELILIVLIIIAAKIIYPFAKRQSYLLHKTVLFITSTCFFLIVCFAMKHNFMLSSNQNALSAVSLPADSSKISSIKKVSSYKDYKALSKPERKAFRKELKKELKAYKKIPRPNRPTAQDALLIFLIVLCGIGLLFLLSILVCGISCGGISGGAILLSLLGLGGIGVGLYFIIRSLHRNIEKESKQNTHAANNKQRNNLFPVVTI